MKAPGTGSKFPLGRFDWIALVVIVCIIAIGLFNLRNVDFYHPRFQHLHQAQLKWYLLGMVMAVMVTFVDLHLFMRLAYPLYGLGVLLLVLVLFAEPINNSRRWLPFFGAVIQPSEFMKLGVVLALSRYLRSPFFAYADLAHADYVCAGDINFCGTRFRDRHHRHTDWLFYYLF